jgi:DNA helicase IV
LSTEDLAHEQGFVDRLYARLDQLRGEVGDKLARALREHGDGPQARVEREAEVARHQERLAQLRAAEPGLCFGRLDLDTGERHYIGRIGMFDEIDDSAPMLIDWRAPAAQPFYLATAAAPDGVHRRRHIRTDGRRVVGVDDEVLELADGDGDPGRESLVNETALLTALAADRTGRMADIVTTIQAEQDRVIRADHRGILVVEGGPGTGKTAVALHRAAYLLYTHRRELTSKGVLIVGPNRTFLRYIDRVLPSLGETAVLPCTVGELFPGVRAERDEPVEVAALKGQAAMAEVVAAAVRDRQEVPDEPYEIVTTDEHPGLAYQPEPLRIDRTVVEPARERARGTRLPHNQARAVFAEELVRQLARQVADRLGADPYADDEAGDGNLLSDADVAAIAEELARDRHLRAQAGRLWPVLTPQQLLSELYADPERLAAAAPGLDRAQRRLLHREPGGGWSPADVPLLDEAAELLGEPVADTVDREAERERAERLEYALGVLEVAWGSRTVDVEDEAEPDILAATDMLDAGGLAQRQEVRDVRPVAERAAEDRTWTFGHVIVDEAQELTPMAWRVLMRRCPPKSMTVVGDLAQTGHPAGSTSWAATFDPYVGERWRHSRLTVNYRTPAEIMDVAAPVLAIVDSSAEPPRSVRRVDERPWALQVPDDDLGAALARVVKEEAATVGDGRVTVLVPDDRADELGWWVPGAARGAAADLREPVVVLTVAQARGLEFDTVVVVEPAQILAGPAHGPRDLYVALTRATRRLRLVHTGDLPDVLAQVPPCADDRAAGYLDRERSLTTR